MDPCDVQPVFICGTRFGVSAARARHHRYIAVLDERRSKGEQVLARGAGIWSKTICLEIVPPRNGAPSGTMLQPLGPAAAFVSEGPGRDRRQKQRVESIPKSANSRVARQRLKLV